MHFTVWAESSICCTTQLVCEELPALHSCLPGLCHTQGYSKQAPWFSLFSDPQSSSVLYRRSSISAGTNHCSLSHTEWFCQSRVIVSQLDVSVGKHYRFVFRAKVTCLYTRASGFQPGFSFLSPAGKPCGWSWVKLALIWCVTSSPLDFQLPGLCCFEFLWVLEALLFLFGIVSLIFPFSFPQSLGPCSMPFYLAPVWTQFKCKACVGVSTVMCFWIFMYIRDNCISFLKGRLSLHLCKTSWLSWIPSFCFML